MKLDVFAVFDSKIGTYAQPFYSQNISTALRAFAFAANDKTTDIGRFPSDMSLFHLGTWDDSQCEFDLVPPHCVAKAITLVEIPFVQE